MKSLIQPADNATTQCIVQWRGGRLFAASDRSPHENGRNSETKSRKTDPKVPERPQCPINKNRGKTFCRVIGPFSGTDCPKWGQKCSVLVWNVSYAILQYWMLLHFISLYHMTYFVFCIAWYCIVLNCIALYHMEGILCYIQFQCTALHAIALLAAAHGLCLATRLSTSL